MKTITFTLKALAVIAMLALFRTGRLTGVIAIGCLWAASVELGPHIKGRWRVAIFAFLSFMGWCLCSIWSDAFVEGTAGLWLMLSGIGLFGLKFDNEEPAEIHVRQHLTSKEREELDMLLAQKRAEVQRKLEQTHAMCEAIRQWSHGYTPARSDDDEDPDVIDVECIDVTETGRNRPGG